jgi:hypothetical protein
LNKGLTQQMTNKNLTTSNGKKLYLATFEFISGEYEQSFQRLLYAKNAKDMDKQIHKYLKDYYGVGNTSEINDDVYYYWYGEIAVKYCGWEEIKDSKQIIDRLLW